MSPSPAPTAAPETTSPPPPAANGAPSMAHSSLWAALSQVALLGIQGIAALAILVTFGKGADTDAVFAAYGVYGILVVMCQTLRLTVVARIVESPSPHAAFDRFLGAGLSLVVVAGVVQILFGGVLARVLTGDLGAHAVSVARWTLAILWVAVGGQLLAALGAALLGVRGEFKYIGLSYVVGGALNIGLLLGLSGAIGIFSVATGVAAGTAISAAAITHRVRATGYRMDRAAVFAGARQWRTSTMLVVASAATVLTQLNFVISASFGARIGVGAVTIYTTAFFGAALIVALTASAAALVLAAPVAQSWDRDPDGLLPHLATVMRAGLLVIAPAVGVAALIGDDVIDVILSGSFSAADADTAIATFVALSGFLVAMLAMQLPLLAAYALSRYNATAVLGVIATGVHVAACAVAVATGKIVLLGVAASLSALTTMTLLLWLVHRRGVLRPLAIVAKETAIAGSAALVCFGVPGLVALELGSGAWDLVAATAGLVAFALVVHWALPSFAETAHRMLAPVVRLPARPGARRAADNVATGSGTPDVLP
jgi:peptidoglycan biosynthesis protein MviN/MurJ (putative lipid II flippase)